MHMEIIQILELSKKLVNSLVKNKEAVGEIFKVSQLSVDSTLTKTLQQQQQQQSYRSMDRSSNYTQHIWKDVSCIWQHFACTNVNAPTSPPWHR